MGKAKARGGILAEMRVDIYDHSAEVLATLQEAAERALEKCGLVAEGYAKRLVRVDTGNLRNSITHQVDEGESAVYIGSNVEYAPYVELGTGRYTEGGRPTPWVYQDDEGNWHWTAGNPAQPFLKPAVADHAQTYRNIIEDEMKNG
jgi:HK97 gp10 family phage protein